VLTKIKLRAGECSAASKAAAWASSLRGRPAPGREPPHPLDFLNFEGIALGGVSNGGGHRAEVGEGAELATVRAFREEVFDGLEEEPFGERDLTAAAGAFGADAGDDDFLGGRRECRKREGFEFGGGLGAAEETFNAADFVEVSHASAGVSKD
jgi:hypothetical protein